MLKLLSTALVGASLLAASPALAQADPSSILVSTADLNLANDADRARLDRRIKAAAKSVCDLRMRGTDAWAMELDCRANILSSAEQQVRALASRTQTGRQQLARNAR
jgi:UrcA family protein